jgi:hypothetical protein
METLDKPAALPSGPSSIESQREQWFSGLFHALETDKLMLETNTASGKTREMYDALMSDDILTMGVLAKEAFNRTLTKKALIDFIGQIRKCDYKPKKIAFDMAESSLLVWAVVADDDFDAEKALYLMQAALNADFKKADYRINTTVVEVSDHLEIPSHYREFPLNSAISQ